MALSAAETLFSTIKARKTAFAPNEAISSAQVFSMSLSTVEYKDIRYSFHNLPSGIMRIR
ncbi:MAG: hypothetical protein AYK19_11615 [Theionarchaea archaeon DG-70-1]|nr:MAG: hypothetical protein AYK19_11615 [Theionarchaea archaeon DG-70-1]